MTEQLIICPRCASNACSEIAHDDVTVWLCFGCGFTTNSTMTEINTNLAEKNLPAIYKDLKWKDTKGLFWYPTSVNMENKGMVFVDPDGKGSWQWASARAILLREGEKHKFPAGSTHKMDMANVQHYAQNNFMDALEYAGYFTPAKK